MISLRKAGGTAALITGAAYAFGFGLFFGFLDTSGYEGPSGMVQFAIDNAAILSAAMIALYLLFAVALVVLGYALDEMFEGIDRGWRRIATAFAVIWSAVLFASGMIMLVALRALPHIAAEDIQHAAHVWAAIGFVQDGLGGGIEIVGGVWSLLIGWLGLASRSLAKGLAWPAIGIGLVGIATAVPGLGDLGAIFGLTQLVWFFALGIALLRNPHSARNRTSDTALSG